MAKGRTSLPRAPQSEIERRAYVVLSRVYYGIHHVDGWTRRKTDEHSVRVTVYGELATYDGSELTRLVIAAHDECVRVAVQPLAPRFLEILFSSRTRPGRFLEAFSYDTHPTLEHAVARNRSHRWIVGVPVGEPARG